MESLDKGGDLVFIMRKKKFAELMAEESDPSFY